MKVTGLLQWVLIAGVSSALPLACSAGTADDFAGGPLATVQEAGRFELEGCASTAECRPDEECCAGYCALPANTTGYKLAFTSENELGYKCYHNAPSDVVNPPANILPDFSWAGYHRGQKPPNPSQFGATILADADSADDAPRIQAALDACGEFTTANNLSRAVVLGAGTFELATPLWIKHNGVTLRGAGQGPGSNPFSPQPHTVLLSTRAKAHTLIKIAPHAAGDPASDNVDDFPVEEKLTDGTSRRSLIANTAVPVGAARVTLNAQPADLTFADGESVVIVRTPNKAWHNDMGVESDFAGWREAAETVLGIATPCTSSSQCAAPRTCNSDEGICTTPCSTDSQCTSAQTCYGGMCTLPAPTRHLRRVEAFNATTRVLRFDIPIVDPIYQTYGGGYVAKVLPARFIEKAGVEDLRIDAQFADNYPEVCTNGTSTLADDTFCGDCAKNGDTCSVASNCGPGYTCESGRCRCPCPGAGGTCSSQAACPSGTFCIDGTCQCPAPRGVCANGAGCNRDDGNWNAVVLQRARDSWVRRVTVKRYGMSAVSVGSWSSFNTVEEVAHLDPESPLEPGVPCNLNNCASCSSNAGNPKSSHRYSFSVGSGIGNLFQRLYARKARHTFVSGTRGTGPHVWLDSVAEQQMADIGPHQRYATGLLFDNIYVGPPDPQADCRWDNLGLTVKNSGDGGTGHGWTGAQVMFWNSDSMMVSEAPPGAMNWVVGGIAKPLDGTSTGSRWELETTTVQPRSLYIGQLKARDPLFGPSVVTDQQEVRRIWDDILRWKGAGRLENYMADPECVEGRPSATTAACCPTNCGSCIESNVNASCRPSTILAGTRSCLTTGAPCFRADPQCQWSAKFNGGTKCCAPGCTQCGGSGCPSGCCIGTRTCDKFPAPCVIKDPECLGGVEGQSPYDPENPEAEVDQVCCSKSCTQCGGPGCGGAGTGCCMGSILASGVSCGSAAAPCVMQ